MGAANQGMRDPDRPEVGRCKELTQLIRQGLANVSFEVLERPSISPCRDRRSRVVIAGRIMSDRSRSQLAFIVTLANRHALRAEDIIGRNGMKIEVWHEKRQKERLRRKGRRLRADMCN